MKYIISILLLFIVTNVQAYDYFDMKKVAMKSYKSGNKTKSFEITKKFIKLHPDELKAKNLLAVLYYWDKDYKKSKDILENILVKNNDYQEAKKLLNKVNKKLAYNVKNSVKKKNVLKEDKSFNNIKKSAKYEDLAYLTKYIADNPQDLQSRIILSKYYFKIQDYNKSYIMAKEALAINSKQKEMLKIIKHIEDNKYITQEKREEDKLKNVLSQYFKTKKYDAYFNLYQALKNKNIKFTTNEYTDALYVSIMVENYEEAQNIISLGVLPKNKHTLQLQVLLADKLSNKVAAK